MNRIIREIKKHLFVYWIFVKNNLARYMEYKANLIAGIMAASGFLFIRCVYVIFFYNTGIKIDGMSADEMMLYTGTFIIMTAIYTAILCDNFYYLPQNIHNGNLDLYMTKPVSLQFMVTLRYFNFALPVPNFIVGIIMVVIAWGKIGIEITAGRIIGYFLCLLSATGVTYSIFLFPQILSFWTVKSEAITQIIDRAWDFNSMPMNIYSKSVRKIGIYIIPLFFISNLPTRFLLGKLTRINVIWMIIDPFILFIFENS